MKISKIDISDDYLIAKNNGEIDYKDNFQLKTTELKVLPEPTDCIVAFFKSFPPIFLKLLLFREFIAKFIGLKTASGATSKTKREKKLSEFEGNIGDELKYLKC